MPHVQALNQMARYIVHPQVVHASGTLIPRVWQMRRTLAARERNQSASWTSSSRGLCNKPVAQLSPTSFKSTVQQCIPDPQIL